MHLFLYTFGLGGRTFTTVDGLTNHVTTYDPDHNQADRIGM